MARTKVSYRRLYELAYKCCILPGFQVHHKDGNSHNNDINNLELVTRIEHIQRHEALGHKIQHNFIAKADWYNSLSYDEKLEFKRAAALYGKSAKNIKRSTEFKLKMKEINKYRSNSIVMTTLDGTIVREFDSVRDAAINLKMQRAHILRVVNGRRRQYKGYLFKYKV